MYKLNLPEAALSLKKEEGKVYIFDIIRKKYVVATPEEWVRQHFIHFLINELKYPRSLFRIEGSLAYNRLQKRSDILIRDREGKKMVLIAYNGKVVAREVRGSGQRADGALVDGLVGGENVISSGPTTLKDGDKIKIKGQS